MKSAMRLQGIRDDWTNRASELDAALTYNRRLWTVLVTAATNPDHPLPAAIKRNIAALGLFIFNHTIALMAEPDVARVGVLVQINRELAAGLRSVPTAP